MFFAVVDFEIVMLYKLIDSHTVTLTFRKRHFPDNRLHWYWQPNNSEEKIHKILTLQQLVRHNEA